MNNKFLENVCLKNYCTFHIGGNAKFLCLANTTTDLINFSSYCYENNLKFKVIGLGANLLFADDGFDGVIIVNKSNNATFNSNSVVADSGINVTNLIMRCYLRNLCNFERLAGIPATVGGAVVNNLGAFGTTFGDYVEYVEVYNLNNGEILKLDKEQCDFSYRNSIFKHKNYVVLRAKLNLKQDDKTTIKDRINNAILKKCSTQPLDYPSAGSVFKRGKIIPAKTIDEIGLKGTRIGDAEISTKHAGFIVNLGNATSKDVKQLIALIKEKVYEKTGEILDSEIEFVD